MKISIIVRARNEARHLPRLIEGIEKQTIKPFEVVLVDSGSTDETVEIAQSAGWVIAHIASEDFSFGRALNVGCSAARGDVLVILSAHVYPTRRDYLERLTASVLPSSRVAVYGRQVGDHRTHFSEQMVMKQWFPNERIPDQGHAFSNNANSCVPRALWQEFQYNETLTGLEDIDFSLRLLSSGGQVRYEHDAPVVHVHEENFSTVKNRYRREAIAYKRIFPGEKMSAQRAFALLIKNVLRDLNEARRELVFFQVLGSVFWFRIAQFVGAWQGFRDSSIVDSELQRRMYYPPGFDPHSDGDADDSEMLISYSRKVSNE